MGKRRRYCGRSKPVSIGILIIMLNKRRHRVNVCRRKFSVLDRIPSQIKNMSDLVECSDQTVSKHFHAVLHFVLRTHSLFLVKPQPISEDSTDPQLQKFLWIEIFGNDRATGENVVDTIDLVNELYRNGCEQEGETGDKYVPLTPKGVQDMEDNNTCKPTEFNQSKVVMGDLNKVIEKGSGSSNENKQLNDIMKGIIGLKVFDKLKVCDELVQNPNRFDFFPSPPDDEQEEYVWMLLDSRPRSILIAWWDTFVYEL
ncbi:hypothetical protein ACS0TY_013163 [Phlomoides rotata]